MNFALMRDVAGVLEERGKRYGDFRSQAALSQLLKRSMHHGKSYELLASDQIEALEMIQHKIARILNGDTNYADSWTDIAWYATLAANRLEAGE